MPLKDLISIVTALMLTSSNIAGPVTVPASEEALTAIHMDKIAVIMESFSQAADPFAAAGAAAAISGADAVVSSAVANMAEEAGEAADEGSVPPEDEPMEQDDESLWYCPDIPMKKEHQKLLWDCCSERGLDYIDMLALISLESNFEEKCSNGKYKGYFQLSSDYGPELSRTLNTENKPLDGAVNIKWGTAFYSWILLDSRVSTLEGKGKRDTALSIYQRGTGGYDRYGLNKKYLDKYYGKRDKIVSYFADR